MRSIGLPTASLALLLVACGGSSPVAITPTSGDHLFTASNAWTRPVASAPLHPQSSAMMARLVSDGGFGTGNFQVDFSFTVLEATASTPRVALIKSSGYYAPDCDSPVTVPLPDGGAIEGETGYTCSGGGDCHLLVVDRAAGRLYESYQADQLGPTQLGSSCTVAWDLSRSYPADLRGQQCTSADAAGLPIAPLLFSADEVAAGSIDHAIRFILPNPRIRAGVFVAPATHAGAPSGAATALPYGSRLRLKASFAVAALPPAAQVVARALQQYGMILADGGNIALTARNDRFTVKKWADLGFDSHSLFAIGAADFEVVDTTAPVTLTYACARNGL
jgi:serine/threonine-protein kinase